MIFHRVLLLLLLVSTGVVYGQPQWSRQSGLSSPLSMGMRFLGNIRNSMTRTFRGIFGGNPPQSQEILPQNRPPIRAPQLPPPQPIPVSPVHSIVTEAPPSSFFTVLHEPAIDATPFPDTHGFTDEGFSPSQFFTGNIPFQGNVEEEHLPFHQEVIVDNSQIGGGIGEHQGPSFAVFEDNHRPSLPLAQEGNFNTHQQFPPSTSFNSFANGQSGITIQDSPIPFGNTNTFNIGNHLRQAPTKLPLAPRPSFVEFQDIVARDSSFQPHNPVVDHHQPQPFVSRADHIQKKSQTFPKVRVTVKKQTVAPYHTSSTSADTNRFTVTPNDHAVVVQNSPPLLREANKPLKNANGHINTGTKIRLTPASGQEDSEEAKVSSYEFGYGVLDNDTGNQFFHAEKREEGLTKGSYKIQLPDGRVQTVTYLADSQGFHPRITYEGKAQYPKNQEEENI